MKRRTRKLSVFDSVLADRLCSEVANSNKSLRTICRELGKGLSARVVYSWLATNEDFSRMYTRAKQFQAEILCDELIELADEVRIGSVTKTLSNGKVEKRTGDQVDRARLQIDTRKWVLAKLLPRKYGDRPALNDEQSDPLGELLKSMERRYNEISRDSTDETPVQ